MGEECRRITGNLVATRLDQVMTSMAWGARALLLAKLHLLAGRDPRFAVLADMDGSRLSRIRSGDQICTDIELMALAIVLQRNPTWLAGMSEEEALTDPQLLHLVEDQP